MLLAWCVSATVWAAEPVELRCEPQTLSGVPGAPLRVELTAETARAWPMRLQIPAVSNLVLRTVERIPVQKSDDSRFVQKRIILWQGVQGGTTTLTNLCAEINGTRHCFPALTIAISNVTPATPPPPPPQEAPE